MPKYLLIFGFVFAFALNICVITEANQSVAKTIGYNTGLFCVYTKIQKIECCELRCRENAYDDYSCLRECADIIIKNK